MARSPKFGFALFVALSWGVLPSSAWAQDPPSRVARLNYTIGSVSMQPAGSQEWAPAVINRPFTTGDYLWADQGSRAELHLDDSVLRLNDETSLGFLNLDDSTVQVRLAQGELQLHVTSLSGDENYEVDTPNAAISLLRNGDYRITVDSNVGTTFLVVRHGQVEVTGGGQAFSVPAGQSAQLSGTDALAYDVETAPEPDGFEAFCGERDMREARIAAEARYVPPEMIGYEDLYDNGVWREEPSYGWVWYPRVTAGWAPYRFGHWAWIEPWGWTWVDDARWGFAPFHYGRWAFVSGAWCWMPGPAPVRVGVAVARPVYAPALVAFFGGSHFSASLAIGGAAGLAWVPLGPGELYRPAYHMSPGYFHQVNVSNTVISRTVNITNVYNNTYVNNTGNVNVANQRFVNVQAPGAVTGMPQSAFAAGRPVSSAGQALPAPQITRLQSAPTTVVAPPVAPTQQALAPTYNGGSAARPPAAVMTRQVVAKTTPPPAPATFADRRQYLQQNVGQPLNVSEMRQQVAARHSLPGNTGYVRPAAPQGEPVRQVQVQPGTRSGFDAPRGGYGNGGGSTPVYANPRYPSAGPQPPQPTYRERAPVNAEAPAAPAPAQPEFEHRQPPAQQRPTTVPRPPVTNAPSGYPVQQRPAVDQPVPRAPVQNGAQNGYHPQPRTAPESPAQPAPRNYPHPPSAERAQPTNTVAPPQAGPRNDGARPAPQERGSRPEPSRERQHENPRGDQERK